MTPEQRQTLIHELREFARAYPEDIFTPFTEEELKRHSVIITRASAAAGRHFAPWFLKAAAALDQMDADEGLMRQAAGYLGSMASGEPLRYSPVCDCDGCEGLRKLRPALRARLGEVPAQGEEADDGEAKA